jgi:hypothetical protein
MADSKSIESTPEGVDQIAEDVKALIENGDIDPALAKLLLEQKNEAFLTKISNFHSAASGYSHYREFNIVNHSGIAVRKICSFYALDHNGLVKKSIKTGDVVEILDHRGKSQGQGTIKYFELMTPTAEGIQEPAKVIIYLDDNHSGVVGLDRVRVVDQVEGAQTEVKDGVSSIIN